eukprot:scaffold67277_cov45-Phaeocystis_antarctica.AAC.4
MVGKKRRNTPLAVLSAHLPHDLAAAEELPPQQDDEGVPPLGHRGEGALARAVRRAAQLDLRRGGRRGQRLTHPRAPPRSLAAAPVAPGIGGVHEEEGRRMQPQGRWCPLSSRGPRPLDNTPPRVDGAWRHLQHEGGAVHMISREVHAELVPPRHRRSVARLAAATREGCDGGGQRGGALQLDAPHARRQPPVPLPVAVHVIAGEQELRLLTRPREQQALPLCRGGGGVRLGGRDEDREGRASHGPAPAVHCQAVVAGAPRDVAARVGAVAQVLDAHLHRRTRLLLPLPLQLLLLLLHRRPCRLLLLRRAAILPARRRPILPPVAAPPLLPPSSRPRVTLAELELHAHLVGVRARVRVRGWG